MKKETKITQAAMSVVQASTANNEVLKPQTLKLKANEQAMIQRASDMFDKQNLEGKTNSLQALEITQKAKEKAIADEKFLMLYLKGIDVAKEQRVQGIIEGILAGQGVDTNDLLYAVLTEDPSVISVMMKPNV